MCLNTLDLFAFFHLYLLTVLFHQIMMKKKSEGEEYARLRFV